MQTMVVLNLERLQDGWNAADYCSEPAEELGLSENEKYAHFNIFSQLKSFSSGLLTILFLTFNSTDEKC